MKKGNPNWEKGKSANPKGRPKGAINTRTKQWEALSESLVNAQAERFNDFLVNLWEGNKKDKVMAADLYLKTLEYFKPKMARTEIKHEMDDTVSSIVFKDAE